ncbi:hypothetical protein BDB00DRAFT_378603 [Zychaea mexicana]|uniref:uncharacterized protein n=1 Tax=Zychaea mexicana TaxID=64656 RepID=UPI0022FE9A9D|nr:uncharacterized protein BDB00DRAFT_378603 [Zychaea mexicana]KAI9493380.1 hypothetical protein BDB00DRAFT_378603 [Zychaea mexicana]
MFAHTQPVIDVTLPPQIVVPDLYLVTGHALMLWFDYLAVRHLQPIIGAIRLRLFLAAIHISIPLVFACPSELLNNTLLGTPWYAASYIVYFADKNFSFRESLANVGSTLLVFQENQQATGYVRIQGLAKIARGVFKWALMKSLVDPWLPHGYSQRLLAIPYWSWESLWLTALIGFKVYCIMGLADIGVGSIQCTLGVPIYDIFDSPILAHSPRDFWR